MLVNTACAAAVLLLAGACGGVRPGSPQAPEPRLERIVEPGEGWGPLMPAFSPDGERVAWFGTDPSFRFRVGIVEEGRLVPLTAQSIRAVDFAWMPDSHSLLVAHHKDRRTEFVIVDLEGRIVDRIAPSQPIVSDTSGMFVLDDDTAVVSAMTTWGRMTPTDLYSLDLGTGRVRNLTKTPVDSEEWPALIDEARWLFTGGLLPHQDGGPTGWAGIFYPGTGERERLTDTSYDVVVARIAPGSSRVIFDTPYYDDRGVWQTDVEGSGPTQVLDVTEVTWPAISPDGRRVLLNDVGTPGDPGGFVQFELP